ncbi:MAG: hypothetical protein P4L92_20745 [Rudaea sp.]|nr:hypothetical protein [Rudaea sp.]
MTPRQALDFVERHGVVCEAAHRGAIPVLAEAVAGETLRGNWWSHPRSREIFAATRAVRAAPQVLVCRIVDAKISFVHERLWPALIRAAIHFPAVHLARVREIHSESGKHVVEEIVFPAWVPAQTAAAADRLTMPQALAALEMLQSEMTPAS